MAKYRHFGDFEFFNVLEKFGHLLWHFFDIGQIFIDVYGQILNKHSSHLVTLHLTDYVIVKYLLNDVFKIMFALSNIVSLWPRKISENVSVSQNVKLLRILNLILLPDCTETVLIRLHWNCDFIHLSSRVHWIKRLRFYY